MLIRGVLLLWFPKHSDVTKLSHPGTRNTRDVGKGVLSAAAMRAATPGGTRSLKMIPHRIRASMSSSRQMHSWTSLGRCQ